MGEVHYSYITVSVDDLNSTLESINRFQDKIVAVTQNGHCYTIFYEDYGNKKDGE